jgi:antitoxin component YwqK of YwqJK toxin-antitoxin module
MEDTTIRPQKVMTLENYKNGKLEGLRSVYYQAEKSQKKLVI